MQPLAIPPASIPVQEQGEKSHAGLPIAAREGQVILELPLPAGWEAYEYYVLEMETKGGKQPLATLEFFSPASPGAVLSLHYRMLPDCRVSVPFPIGEKTLMAQSAFLPPRPGIFKGGIRGKPMTRAQVSSLRLTVAGEALETVILHVAALLDAPPEAQVAGKAVVDELGQRKDRVWAGKASGPQAMIAYLHSQRQQARTDGGYPRDWSGYGGWLKKQFGATGWFRTHFDGRRWWLVDPDGYAFFSNGVCYGARTGIYGLTEGLQALHDWLPDPGGEFAAAWTGADRIPQYVVRNGREGAQEHRLFNFARANMIRAFGPDWWNAWVDINAARLKRWGFNTIGVGVNEYGDEETAAYLARAKIPYVWTLKFFPLTDKRIFRDFPDVFSQEYRERCDAFAQKELAPLKDDPFLIGYFVTNEPEWFFADINLTERLMASAQPLASKYAFIDRMRRKYGDIHSLNRAWGTQYGGFDGLLVPAAGLDEKTAGSREDFAAFHKELVEAYGRTVSSALRRADPNHLNLGMRYSHPSPKLLGAKPDYFDVFSFNRYAAEPATAAGAMGASLDMPMMVGEWHIGAKDSGLDAFGLLYADNVRQRACAMRYYSEQATKSRNLVGIHYFEYNDQPLLGRFDGECYNIGLIDVCNRPYEEVVKACEDFARRMYPLLDGQEEALCPPVPLHRML